MRLWTWPVDRIMLALLIGSNIVAAIGIYAPIAYPTDMILSLCGMLGMSVTGLYFCAGILARMGWLRW